MKIVLTDLAKEELNNLNKIHDALLESNSDIDLYYDFSSYDQLLFDVQMFVDGAYCVNEFESLEQFASDINEHEGRDVESVLNRINKAISLNLAVIK